MATSRGEAAGAPQTLSPAGTGPILFALGGDGQDDRLRALVVCPDDAPPPALAAENRPVEAVSLLTAFGRTVHAYNFTLPSGTVGTYTVDGDTFRVTSPATAPMRIAYVSCNGQEAHDLDRPLTERDAVWQLLADEQHRDPFTLLLQGGDQLYADDVLHCHPEVERWAALAKTERGIVPLTEEIGEALRRFYFERYLITYSRPAFASLAAHVPSIMMWDDHDIIDGWGSHPPEMLDSPIGRAIFAAAREMFLVFQLATRPDTMPAIVSDKTGSNLGIVVRYPGLSIIAPDLRSERRLERVMGENGWAMLDAAFDATPHGDRIFVMSSVPALGPRLSWAEFIADALPRTNEYEDDLRDQWQSRTHRVEWRRFLAKLASWPESGHGALTVLSGEIHLATRGEMRLKAGGILHQLVASGIAHPAPNKAYPVVLGLLARFGESPLKGRKIRIRALPDYPTTYASERNYLVVARNDRGWTAEWELEMRGRTPPLAI
ncbi:alkaline phosphatase family protein [Jiella sp. MQZ9-1]|uniref:Alkaline phosphatase family protein n=1 Tax=Jiella flava TaxID=2816857 RepID=A0A939JX11_9HYPH|nr:alkaline phosphatase D family protein [Jiella flava]MBO0663577.1 alkaline phosphatase family protein [Jiella flava]MCD2472153.1 alkaline phosphatase family protein [Jiella flava]